jgi:hypothetical protein
MGCGLGQITSHMIFFFFNVVQLGKTLLLMGCSLRQITSKIEAGCARGGKIEAGHATDYIYTKVKHPSGLLNSHTMSELQVFRPRLHTIQTKKVM